MITRFVIAVAALLGAAVSSYGAAGDGSITRGTVLVASPALSDPNFAGSVVLICEHGDEGTVGLILNRPTNVLLSEAIPQEPAFKGTTYRLFAGGPVQQGHLMILYRTMQPPAASREILSGVFLGADVATATRLITRPQPSETFRTYAGHAGWGPGQLQGEMASGAWAPLPGTSQMAFDKDPATLWLDLLDALRNRETVEARSVAGR